MRANRDFTLIELLVVIPLVGTLASVVLASLNSAREKARDSKRLADMQEVVKALQLYWRDHAGTYPPHGDVAGCNATCLSDAEKLVTDECLPAIPLYDQTEVMIVVLQNSYID